MGRQKNILEGLRKREEKIEQITVEPASYDKVKKVASLFQKVRPIEISDLHLFDAGEGLALTYLMTEWKPGYGAFISASGESNLPRMLLLDKLNNVFPDGNFEYGGDRDARGRYLISTNDFYIKAANAVFDGIFSKFYHVMYDQEIAGSEIFFNQSDIDNLEEVGEDYQKPINKFKNDFDLRTLKAAGGVLEYLEENAPNELGNSLKYLSSPKALTYYIIASEYFKNIRHPEVRKSFQKKLLDVKTSIFPEDLFVFSIIHVYKDFIALMEK